MPCKHTGETSRLLLPLPCPLGCGDQKPSNKKNVFEQRAPPESRLPESREVLGPLLIKRQQIRQGRAVQGPELA